jgi:aldehyde:ferredoxin oxidoreductase
VAEGPFVVTEARKPEYETLAALGAANLVDSVEAVIKAGDLCDRYGMDTIEAGYAIAFAMECYEKGIIGKEETGGIELTWGNAAAMVAMLEKMAKREGFGAVLADGAAKAAERIGKNSAQFAPNFHGQVVDSIDPRPYPAYGTGFLADPTPGRHMTSATSGFLEGGRKLRDYPEMQVPITDKSDYKSRGVQYAVGSNWNLALTSTGICFFGGRSEPFPLPEFISAVTGWDFTVVEALTVGRRIQTLRQLFNIREGLSPKDFQYPDRMKEPVPTGPHAGETTDFNALRRGYYEAMDWDIETGKPSKQSLKEVGLI